MASYFFARKKKRNPVVADPKLWSVSSVDDDKPFHAEPKSESEKQQLVTALKDHYVFSALSTNDILQVIHRMRKRSFSTGNDICTEGTTGDEFFVLAQGEADIIVKGEKVGSYKPGQSFGELALLYSCTRAATIKATSSCTCWAVDAATFRKVAIRSKQGAARGRLDFLKKVPLLQGLDSGTLQRVADALKRVEFAAGSKIVTEGEPGDDFYLIEDGEVKCTKRNGAISASRGAAAPPGEEVVAGFFFDFEAVRTDLTEMLRAGSDEQHLLTLKRGDYFGEMVRARRLTGAFSRRPRHRRVRLRVARRRRAARVRTTFTPPQRRHATVTAPQRRPSCSTSRATPP